LQSTSWFPFHLSVVLLFRSKLFVDGSLLVNNDGLHGMVEKCGQTLLKQGSHIIYIEGFQAGGGVGMEARYTGPDTGGKTLFLRSGFVPNLAAPPRQYFFQCDPSELGSEASLFTVCMFRSEVFMSRIPSLRQADTGLNRLYYVGKGQLPVVDLHDLNQFRAVIPNTPNVNYAWSIYGNLNIGVAGAYTLCIESDDGFVKAFNFPLL
jgi:hypothetical protein